CPARLQAIPGLTAQAQALASAPPPAPAAASAPAAPPQQVHISASKKIGEKPSRFKGEEKNIEDVAQSARRFLASFGLWGQWQDDLQGRGALGMRVKDKE